MFSSLHLYVRILNQFSDALAAGYQRVQASQRNIKIMTISRGIRATGYFSTADLKKSGLFSASNLQRTGELTELPQVTDTDPGS